MKLLARIKRFWGWRDCPYCGHLVWFRFIQIPVVFVDEPPLFARWQCPKCKWLNPIAHTVLMDKGAQAHGYKDFMDWAQHNVKELEDGTPL